MPFKSEALVSPSPLGFPKLSPSSLEIQMLWWLILHEQDAQAGDPDVVLRTLTPVGEPL